jgi:hypothetical protein
MVYWEKYRSRGNRRGERNRNRRGNRRGGIGKREIGNRRGFAIYTYFLYFLKFLFPGLVSNYLLYLY